MSRKIPDHWSKWQKEILNGIDSIPKTGVPGTIIAYGAKSVPILTGEEAHELILTASQCGKGKVIVFAHNGYIGPFTNDNEEFHLLVKNIKKWATNGLYTCDESIVLNITGRTAICDLHNDKYKLFVWDCEKKGDNFIQTMVTVVKNRGVGLVMGMCPWGWQQLNNDRPLEEACFSAVLNEAGVCYTSDYTDSGDDGGFFVLNNQAMSAHFGVALSSVAEDLKSTSRQQIQVLQRAISNLSDKVWRDLSGPFTRLLSNLKHKLKPPCAQNPVTDDLEKLLLSIQLRESQLSAYKDVTMMPDCKCFPGDFDDCNHLVGKEVCLKITARFNNERHTTGYYIPARWRLKVTVTRGGLKNWSLRIGAHSDKLPSEDEWRRWPVISNIKTLKENCTEFVSPFGGLVYLENSNTGSLEVKLENVIKAPHYDVTDPNLCAIWERRRFAPGLWAELGGEHVIFTLPSNAVRELQDPGEFLRLWDKVICAHHHLKGSNPFDQKRERVVCDEQPSVGYMHSGYPVVTHLDISDPLSDVCVMDPARLQVEGSWGLYHEFGHNMQEDEWTFEGTVEVTCNIFTLHAMEVVSGKKPWIHNWLQDQLSATYTYLRKGENFEQWKEHPGVALFIYAQMVHSFGWGSFKVLFRRYKNESLAPKSNQEKIDLWFSLFSEVVGYNILPMAMFWGIPISNHISTPLSASGLSPFLPDDEITNHESAVQRVKAVKSRFGQLTRNVTIRCAAAEFQFDEKSKVVRQPSVTFPS